MVELPYLLVQASLMVTITYWELAASRKMEGSGSQCALGARQAMDARQGVEQPVACALPAGWLALNWWLGSFSTSFSCTSSHSPWWTHTEKRGASSSRLG